MPSLVSDAELLRRLTVSLDWSDHCAANAAKCGTNRTLRHDYLFERDRCEWQAFECAAQLEERGVVLSDRAQALMARIRDKAANFEAEYGARYGDLGLSDHERSLYAEGKARPDA